MDTPNFDKPTKVEKILDKIDNFGFDNNEKAELAADIVENSDVTLEWFETFWGHLGEISKGELISRIIEKEDEINGDHDSEDDQLEE